MKLTELMQFAVRCWQAMAITALDNNRVRQIGLGHKKRY